MNKRAIDYNNQQRWEAAREARLKKPYKQSQRSQQRSTEMKDTYEQNPKKLILGLARVNPSKSPQKDQLNKPGWNDRTVVNHDNYKEKLETRFIRSDYGKENPPKKTKNESQQKMKLIHQSQKQLQKLREVVNTENMTKGAEISKKSQLEIRTLQQQMEKDNQNKNDYNQYLSQKYEKIEEQKNLNNFLEQQIRIIKSHKKDLSKAEALQGNHSRSHSYHSQERQNRSMSKDRQSIPQEVWSQKLIDMKSKAEDNKQKLQFRNNFFQQEDEEEQEQSGLDVYPKREFEQESRRSHSRMQSQDSHSWISKPQRKNVLRQQQNESDHYDKMLEISQQDAWKQYEIHQSIKQNRIEKLVDSQSYNQVEKALNNLQERVDPIRIQSEQQKKNAIFSGNLIGRATTKLIKVHHQKIIELLIDDLLLEMVGILSQEEAVKSNECEKMTRECLVNDYLDEFREMAYEQCQIVDRMKEMQNKKHTEFINFRHTTPAEQNTLIINPAIIQFEQIKVELSLGVIVNVLEKRSEFLRKTQKLDHYSKKNMNAFSSITEKLLDDILLELSKELDETNGQYAEIMFNHEFK